MDHTPTSFPSSPSARSASADHTTETCTAYSSPARVIPHYIGSPSSAIGLGISDCSIGVLTGHSSPLMSQPYPSPAPDWREPLYPSQRLLEPNLNVGFPPTTNYGVSAPSFDVYHAQPALMPYDYGCSVNAGGSNETMYYQQSLPLWMNTPRSDTATYPDAPYGVKEEQEESWMRPLMHSSGTTEARMTPHMDQETSRKTLSKDPQPHPNSGILAGSDPNVDCGLRQPQPKYPYEVILKWTKEHEKPSNNRRRKIGTASGLQCSICGRSFTRRSNCHEHMKRHDPSRKKSHPCNYCEKTFGRNGDLRRHVETIHYGIRRFVCDECGQRFTRQDILSRHTADGCANMARSNSSRDRAEARRPR
ncbi:hypothetical protein BDV59DRAFT_65655 [Aspergillus ambiguus]|uniref:putative C2H2 finger domain protein (Ezf) n=1 Tax=Aspergillus ambiguus TaxID=176160 RepID=UPI003CCE2395